MMAEAGFTAAGFMVSDLPTADEEPKSWNKIWIAGFECPGDCLPLDGERMRSVDHKKAKGGSNDILTDNGLDPTEVTIRIRTTSGPVFRQLYDFYLKYMDPDRVLSRLSIVTVAHPQLYARGIKLGYFFSAPLPKPTHDSGIYPYISEFRFKIVGPKTQITGGSSKPKAVKNPGGNVNPGGVIFVDRAVALISRSATEGTKFFNEGNLGNDIASPNPTTAIPELPPLNKGATLYTPAQIGQIAGAGDPTARFIDTQVNQFAPVLR